MRSHALALLVALALPPTCWGQKPVISPGGVVNAASYSDQSLIYGSIVSIFGQNLAASTQSATSTPLPTSLGGTTVTVEGFPAPLFFVSPNQINFQLPSGGGSMVVSTTSGTSDPYLLPGGGGSFPGIFTQDASGCGSAAALNVASDGSVSLNSPSGSVSPGDYLEVFGTGEEYDGTVVPPSGIPTPASPLIAAYYPALSVYDFDWAYYGSAPEDYSGAHNWAGRAPGLIGVDQFNVQVPLGVREGCAVPLRILSGNISQPVTVAIRTGGGPCVDPPEQGYGQITWQKAENIAASGAVTETDSVTVSLQESPGKQAPPPAVFIDDNNGESPLYGSPTIYYGPSCRIAGYRSLDAGTITVQSPGAAPATVPAAPLQQGQVSGLTVYQAALPVGTIQGGSFTASATGGADVSAFQSTVPIGAEIHFTTNLTSLVVGCYGATKISWTGGDPNAWVTVSTFGLPGVGDDYSSYRIIGQARVSDGYVIAFGNPNPGSATPCDYYTTNIAIEVDPDPSEIPALSAAGLSLGGQHTWKYLYYFTALIGV
jgi:uncharacterized protein (TIGR03437 family)